MTNRYANIMEALKSLDSAGGDVRMSPEMRSYIEGMSVSVDVSTGDHDAGHRYFGTVTEVMDDDQSKHGVTLLVQDAAPNFERTAQPAVGEEIMVNAAHDVYTLPLQPSGLSSGPRFVVHVRAPEPPVAVDELAKDAARYRWLRDANINTLPYDDHGIGPEFPCGDDLDTAIDAAMAKGGDI